MNRCLWGVGVGWVLGFAQFVENSYGFWNIRTNSWKFVWILEDLHSEIEEIRTNFGKFVSKLEKS